MKRKTMTGKTTFRMILMLAVCFMVIASGKVYAEGYVHALVINGRDYTLKPSKKIYQALQNNKLPKYVTKPENIHFFSFESNIKKNRFTTKEAFYAALDAAYSQSTKNDLNILYVAGHGSPDGIPIKMKGRKALDGILYPELAAHLNQYKGLFVYISDACYGRAFYTQGVSSLKNGDTKFLCLYAVNEKTESNFNIFPKLILKGIGYKNNYEKGPADSDNNGEFSARELKNYGLGLGDGTGPGASAPIFQFTYLKMNRNKVTLNLDTKDPVNLEITMKRHVKGVEREVIWSSSNEKVVTVSETSTKTDGTHKVTLIPHKTGTTTIKAYLVDRNEEKCCGTEVECEVEVIDYRKIYKKFLAKGKTIIKETNNSFEIELRSYCLLDVDRDKIPELFVKNTDPSQGASYDSHYIYSIKKGKLVYCGYIVQRGNPDVYYSKKYKALQNSGWTNFVGGTWAHLYQLKKYKLEQFKYCWEGYEDLENTKYIYLIGSSDTTAKQVSKAKYSSFIKKYFNKKDIKTCKFKFNNSENRKKDFG